jgi:hypothetical protein
VDNSYRPLRTNVSLKNVVDLGSQLKRASRSIGMGSKPAIPKNSSVINQTRAQSLGMQRVRLHSKLEATFQKGSANDTIETR